MSTTPLANRMSELFYKILGLYSLFLVVCGTVCNLLTLINTCQIKKPNTFIYLRFIAVSDLIALYYWNLDKFIVNWFGNEYQSMSLTMCKIGSFLQYTTLQFSSWLLVVEQVLNWFTFTLLCFKTETLLRLLLHLIDIYQYRKLSGPIC